MSKIFIRINSKIHRNLLDSFKETNQIKSDTTAILEIIEEQKLQFLQIKQLKNQIKTLKIKMFKKD
jgi:hypothetical protein